MPPRWSFRRMVRGEMNVDPIQREFFTTEALEGGLAEALVREAIQNSLDAAQQRRKVRVRFWLSGTSHAASTRDVEQFFGGLRAHLGAKGSGLRTLPNQQGSVPFLVIEDFETTGLRGDPREEQDVDDGQKKNDFYYFWRNVGRSGKEQRDRGRWGLGKTVFPASSQINTFFGLTIRRGKPERLLMGQAVLRVHQLDGHRHYPYGYFGLIDDRDGFAMPVDREAVLSEFGSKFSLTRRNESGLSIVIPYPHDEITAERIAGAIIRQYFYAILAGALVVTVGSDNLERELDDANLLEAIEGNDETFRRELLPFVKLAEWACNDAQGLSITLQSSPQGDAPKWTRDAIQADQLPDLRTRFERGDRLAFLVPVWVKPVAAEPQQSFFHVFLQRDLAMENHQPKFIREGIIVSDAFKGRLHGVYALVVVEDSPLATLLGDAENPAHTEWQERSAHFRDRYQHGASVLRFVKNSVVELVQMITHSGEESDRMALADVFFLPESPESEEQRKEQMEKQRPGARTQPPDIEVPRRKEKFLVSQINGGFSLSHKEGAAGVPDRIDVVAAYEVRRGNAFRRYQPADFELDKPPITISADSADVTDIAQNRLVLVNLKPGFRVTVCGFDSSRDLVVRAVASESPQEKNDDSQV
jgi:hypothetical protein